MKQVTLIFLMLIPVIVYSQQRYIDVYTMTVPTGTDTTYVLSVDSEASATFKFNYKRLDDVDAVLDVGCREHPDSLAFDRLVSDDLPFTLADSSVTFRIYQLGAYYVAFKLTRNSVTPGLTIDLIHSSSKETMALPGSVLKFMGKE